jgi:hypothetical protein
MDHIAPATPNTIPSWMRNSIIPAVGLGFLVLNRYGACLGWYRTRYQAQKAIKALRA